MNAKCRLLHLGSARRSNYPAGQAIIIHACDLVGLVSVEKQLESTFMFLCFHNILNKPHLFPKIIMTNQEAVVTQTDLSGIYTKISAGKVRDLYQLDERTLLVVSTDRVSAFDVILNNVSHPHELQKPLIDLLSGYPLQRLSTQPSFHTLVLRPH